MRSMRTLPLLALLSFVAACNSSSSPGGDDCTDPNVAGCIVVSAKERVETPNVSDADLATVVAGNTTFAVDLYQRLRADPGNLFYSPFSISQALAMTYAGARGETATQMAKALHFPSDAGVLHAAFDALDLALGNRGEGAKGKDGQPFRLNVANSLWGQIGYDFQTPFLDTLAESYGAGVHVADFAGAAETSRGLVNKWISEKTEAKIPELIAKGMITSDTKFVLANAVYFNASWAVPFEKEGTHQAPFTRADGSTVQVDMMNAGQDTGYAEGDGYQALDLPYSNGSTSDTPDSAGAGPVSMTLILPAAGTLDAFETSLTGDKLKAILESIHQREVVISMPKFKMKSSFDLPKELDKLGMVDAFTTDADFSGISAQSKLTIRHVVHQATVDVDESGTEAAAATAVIGGDTAYNPDPPSIKLDHPFLVVIRDKPTGTILFLGRVADPQG
ncbi:Serine protease inhibitor (serpin family) [Minicystis rosea]|nr:Serine protease inhibitor (serpin family) [Minicystis rosea]